MPIATSSAAAPVDLSENTLFIGHSLVNFDIPAMVESLVEFSGGSGQTDAQITNGAPLRWNWDNSATAEGVDARAVLPSGDYGAVVMTEAIPLINNVRWNDTSGYSSNFYNLAISSNPDTQVYLYETWHSILSGTGQTVQWDDYDHIPWRDRLDQDLSVWQGIVDGVNAQRADGAPPMVLIPAGQALGRLSDAIDAGSIVGLSSINELFADDIHLNDIGHYFVALVKAGAIHGIDPRDMPNQVEASWGNQVTIPADLADAFQEVAVETLEIHGFLGDEPTPEPMPEPTPEPEPPIPSGNTDPVAVADTAHVRSGESVVIDVLDNDYDADGDRLMTYWASDPEHGTTRVENGRVIYTPDPGFTGTDTFGYSLDDHEGGIVGGEVTVEVSEPAEPEPTPEPAPAPTPADSLDFNGLSIEDYRPGRQDFGDHGVSEDGAALMLDSQAWQSVLMDVEVTVDTWLSFDFSSAVEGEIHGIMFTNDDTMSEDTAFSLFGTQDWGIQDYAYDGAGDSKHIEINVGQHFTGNFDRIVFLTDDDARVGADSVFENVILSTGRPASVVAPVPAPEPEPAPAPEPVDEIAAGLTSPVIGMGLNEIRDYSTQDPFIDLMKTSREWIGHVEWWGGMTYEEMQAGGYLDEHGWLREMPDGLRAVEALMMVDIPVEAISFEGRFRVTWEGEGTIQVRGGSNVVYGDGEIWFDRSAEDQMIGIQILDTDPNGNGNYLRDIEVVRERHIEVHETGAIFNPEWIEHIEDLRLVRFMDWMDTNWSTQSEWSDRPQLDDVTYTRKGAPVELMVQLANEIGADPWFTMPHQATEEYMTEFATYVRDNLDPDLKAHVEYSNEIWNFMFGQTQWALEGAEARWGTSGGAAWMEYAGMHAAQMAQTWDRVYGDEAEGRLLKVIGGQTDWMGLEEPLLTAPRWVAEDPVNNRPPAEYFDAYTITGYFGGIGDNKVEETRIKIDQSLAAAEQEADAQGLTGSERADYVDAHRYDLAVDWAVSELRADELVTLVDEYWVHHAQVARNNDLELIMYEGGTHIVGVGDNRFDETLTDFFTHLNYTSEMGMIYEDLLQAWQDVGGTVFNAFVDVKEDNGYGSFGHLRHLEDSNPRWDTLMEFNEQNQAWWETRTADTFDHGILLEGTATSDTLTGTVEEDILLGGAGDDFLFTEGGGDYVHGGAGYDIAFLVDSQSQYTFTTSSDGLMVATLGTDRTNLRDVEAIVFQDAQNTVVATEDLFWF